jgi:hypothetical protein
MLLLGIHLVLQLAYLFQDGFCFHPYPAPIPIWIECMEIFYPHDGE